jgi:hypothetical protein
MLQTILDCLTFMPNLIMPSFTANEHFLGRAVQQPQLAPWEKDNTPDLHPWEREAATRRQSVHGRQHFHGEDAYMKQKQHYYEQDSETAWQQGLEDLQAVENSYKQRVDNTETTTQETRAAETVQPDNAENDENAVDIRNAKPARKDLIPYPSQRQVKGRSAKLFPTYTADNTTESKATAKLVRSQSTPQLTEVKRSWPEPRAKNERRMTASNYNAVEIHGFFGLIDDGSDGAGRMLVVHVPRWVKGFFLDIKQGDVVHVYHARGVKVGGALTVLSTGRHKYYGPGRRVTTCTICVPEEQWAPFAE